MPETDSGRAMKILQEALKAEEAKELERAFERASAALAAFSEAGDRTGTAASHHLLGALFAQTGRLSEAIRHIDAAIPLRESTGDHAGLAALHQQRFELGVRSGDEGLALEAARKVVDTTNQSGDREAMASALHQLAQVCIGAEELDAAASHVREGLQLSDREGEERARMAFVLLQAQLDLLAGDQDRAVSTARDAVALARVAGHRQALADALHQLGAVLEATGAFEAAAEVLEESVDARELLRDLHGRALGLWHLAGVEQQLGRPRKAITHLLYAARTWNELGDSEQELELLHSAGELAAAMGDHPRAIEIGRAQIVAGEAQGPGAHGAAWFVLAQREVGAGDLAGAELSLTRAQEMQAAAGQQEAQAVSLGLLGQIQYATGRPDEALATLTRARRSVESLDSELLGQIDELIREVQD